MRLAVGKQCGGSQVGGSAHRSRPGVRRALGALGLAAALLLSSCSASPQVSRAYPADLVLQLAELKAQSGLFARPSSSALGDDSLYSTALFAAVDPLLTGSSPPGLASALAGEAAATTEVTVVTPLWFTWAWVQVAGAETAGEADAAPLVLPAADGFSAALPEPSLNPGQEIGTLSAWLDTVTRLTPEVPPEYLQQASKRLDVVSVDALGSPYLMWRLDRARHALGEPRTPRFAKALTQLRPPATAQTPTDVLDLRGYLEIAAAKGGASAVPDAAVPDAAVLSRTVHDALAALPPGDDLLATTLIRCLQLLGHPDDAEPYLADARARLNPQTGLLRTQTTVTGSIDATYLVAQLVPQDFADIAGADTSAALTDFLENTVEASPLDRLKAVAALKLNGDRAWKKHRGLVDAAQGSLAAGVVGEAELGGVVELIDTLRVLSTSVPAPQLEIFAVQTEEDAFAARLALANADMFANTAEIAHAFPTVQAGLLESALHPAEPVKSYVVGLRSLLEAATVPTTAPQQAEIGEQLRALLGCEAQSELYRESFDRASPCSLEATRAALTSSFAYAGSTP